MQPAALQCGVPEDAISKHAVKMLKAVLSNCGGAVHVVALHVAYLKGKL
jgi:hypothetical protein